MAVGGEEPVVALVVVEGEPDAGSAPGGELVAKLQRRGARRDHVDAFQRVRAEEAEVFEDLVAGGDRAADGLAIEPGEEELAAVEVDGGGPGRVEEIRVQVAELEQLPQAGDLERQAGGVAVAEQVVLRQLRLAEEALTAGEAESDLEGAGELLLDRHLDDHLVVARSAPGIELDRIEEAECGDARLGDPDASAAIELALVDAHLAADDLVARLVVADHLDLLDGDQVPFLESEVDVDGPVLGMDVGVGGDVRVRVPLVLVDVRQYLEVALQDRLAEARPALGLHQREELVLRLEQVACDVDLADVVGIALLDGDGDEDEPAVRRQLDGRLAELHVQIAAVVVQPLQHVLVAREGVLAIGARAGEEAPEASLLGDHRRRTDHRCGQHRG